MNDKQQIFVSIIVPIYNTPLRFFKECLDSLTSQTLKETEFLLIFDGENNELFSFSKQYQEKDSRFILSIQPHKGVSATRNYGLKQAQGEYITFVDADDYLNDNKSLEKCYDSVKSNDSDITIFNWAQKEKNVISLWSCNKEKLSDSETEECLRQFICIENPAFSGAPWAKFYKRLFLNANKIHFKSSCIIGQDRVFNYEAFSLASKISYSTEVLYTYVTNSESATQRYRPNSLAILLNYIDELSKISCEKHRSLIGKETLNMFYVSWNTCYMHPDNKNSFFRRMKEISDVVISNRFQNLIRSVDTTVFDFPVKIEIWLFKHKITFPIWLHGLKFAIIKSISNGRYHF
jgi:glycosyltransferase involved in cell wall biosynthesis